VCEPNGEECGRVDCLEGGHCVVSAGLYAGPLALAVQRLKYQKRPDLARPLGGRLARTLRQVELAPATLLVPVPLHPARLAERGYNQAALVARAAAGALGLESRPRALERTLNTKEQATLSRSARLENVAFAFSVREMVGDRPIVIVDDVVTTGATTLACATALGEAGAVVVGIAAIARADRVDAGLHDSGGFAKRESAPEWRVPAFR
jgi:ComF family protein